MRKLCALAISRPPDGSAQAQGWGLPSRSECAGAGLVRSPVPYRTWAFMTQPFWHCVGCCLKSASRMLGLVGHARLPALWGTHDFQRGHAEDLRAGGARLCESLWAGDALRSLFALLSPRLRYFPHYVLAGTLEVDQVAEAHAGFSSLSVAVWFCHIGGQFRISAQSMQIVSLGCCCILCLVMCTLPLQLLISCSHWAGHRHPAQCASIPIGGNL